MSTRATIWDGNGRRPVDAVKAMRRASGNFTEYCRAIARAEEGQVAMIEAFAVRGIVHPQYAARIVTEHAARIAAGRY